jgi:hypothetical protein
MYLVAFFAGRWQPHESPVDAYCRGIGGCQNGAEFRSLSPDEVSERHAKAWERMCKRRGIDPVTLQPWDKVEKMLKKLDRAGIVPAESWAAKPPKPPPPRPPRPPHPELARELHRKMASVYCQAVLCHDQRITLDGAPAEPVGAEAKDMAAKQLPRLAARKAATKAAKAAAPAAMKPPPAPNPANPTTSATMRLPRPPRWVRSPSGRQP